MEVHSEALMCNRINHRRAPGAIKKGDGNSIDLGQDSRACTLNYHLWGFSGQDSVDHFIYFLLLCNKLPQT